MTALAPASFRSWLAGLAECGALVPAAAVLERLPAAEVEERPPELAPRREPMLDVREAAERLHVSEKWIYRHKAKLGARKIGGVIRIAEADLERYLARRVR